MTGGQQNPNIQALRALAAILVVVGHAAQETQAIAGIVGRPAADLSFMYWGLGVDIFFVISGFIMVYTSADLFGRPGAWRIFLHRRLTRIVPLYWLLTTALLLGSLAAPRLLNVPIDDWRHVLASYLFIPSLRAPGEIRPVMALGWTLNMEMLFYVLFAAALALPYRAGLRALSLVIVTLALIGLIVQPTQVQLAFWTQSIVLEFLFGCLLAAAYRRGARLTPAAGVLIGLLGMAGMLRFSIFEDRLIMPDAIRWGVPALLVVAAASLTQASTARAMIWLAAIGNASYSLYLIHPFVLRPMRNVWIATVGDAVPLMSFVAVATLLSIVAGAVLYRCVERPLLRLVNGRAAAGPVPAQPALQPAVAGMKSS